MKKTKRNLTTRMLTVTVMLLLVTNVILSVILLHNSRQTAKTLIQQRMLDIANCAAASVNGDNFKAITNDKTAPEFTDVYRSLAAFRDNINKDHLKYIYGVYHDGDDFRFAVDTDPDDPADYGEIAAHGDGIYDAIEGSPTVDNKSYTDEWGTFYSAYSPVRDSGGNIVGLVMVDFDAHWYSRQIMGEMSVIITVCVISLTINAAAVFITTDKLRHNMSRLYTELDILSDDISDLTEDSSDDADNPFMQSDKDDEISKTIYRTRYLQSKVRSYISRMKSQAFSDAMTGVGNRTAFTELVDEINRKISDGTADFAAAVFDINGLKHINDDIGHDAGDKIIIDAASALKEIFGRERLYRIGGDEFMVILDNATSDEMESMFERLDHVIEDINRQPDRRKAPLYISKGAADFRPGLDSHFNDIFKRADEVMYDNKAAFYARRK